MDVYRREILFFWRNIQHMFSSAEHRKSHWHPPQFINKTGGRLHDWTLTQPIMGCLWCWCELLWLWVQHQTVCFIVTTSCVHMHREHVSTKACCLLFIHVCAVICDTLSSGHSELIETMLIFSHVMRWTVVWWRCFVVGLCSVDRRMSTSRGQ